MASVHIFVLSVLSFLVLSRCMGEMRNFKCPPPFNCGKLGQISPPFSNRSNSRCGLVLVGDCDQPVQKIQFQRGSSGKWYEVRNISQANTMNILDKELNRQLQIRDCRVFNNLSLPSHSFYAFKIETNITLFRCNRCSNCSPPLTDFNYTKCNHDVHYNRPNKSMPSCPPHCSTIQLPLSKTVVVNDDPFKFIDSQFILGLHVWPPCLECIFEGGYCQDDKEGRFQCAGINLKGNGKRRSVKVGIAASAAGFAILLAIGSFFWIKSSWSMHILLWKKKNQNNIDVEAILKSSGSLAPKRYSYSEVKKMTNLFKNKLGQGGYGSVYLGELLGGRRVAVKVLEESEGDGEEFVNEVASISKTSHVNIVTLLGFCFEGPKRALIYEFMPNGSLEKFIYEENPSIACRQLEWETLYQIALGIARGLEYLHRGCNTKILHFDIKPHNILLDEEFCPKITDFGLAKLCTRKESIISMLGARGTPGYIAPEVFCRNFGNVSHKSDVYSYGMMVLEMVGGRKNIKINCDRTSEIFFPHWICRRLEVGDELGIIGITGEQENEKARKMIIVGLCCIQADPSSRPPMHRVMDMLQGSLESLQMPPSPFLFSSPRRSLADVTSCHDSLEFGCS